MEIVRKPVGDSLKRLDRFLDLFWCQLLHPLLTCLWGIDGSEREASDHPPNAVDHRGGNQVDAHRLVTTDVHPGPVGDDVLAGGDGADQIAPGRWSTKATARSLDPRVGREDASSPAAKGIDREASGDATLATDLAPTHEKNTVLPTDVANAAGRGFGTRLSCASRALSDDGVRQAAARLEVDTALMHLGGVRFPVTEPVRYTMTARDAVRLCRLMTPRTAVAIHHEGWKHSSKVEIRSSTNSRVRRRTSANASAGSRSESKRRSRPDSGLREQAARSSCTAAAARCASYCADSSSPEEDGSPGSRL